MIESNQLVGVSLSLCFGFFFSFSLSNYLSLEVRMQRSPNYDDLGHKYSRKGQYLRAVDRKALNLGEYNECHSLESYICSNYNLVVEVYKSTKIWLYHIRSFEHLFEPGSDLQSHL